MFEAGQRRSVPAEGIHMALTLDTAPIDLGDWDTELSPVNGWLAALWGIEPGKSSPRSQLTLVPVDCVGSAGWLAALWGFHV
jgi:hypothetical protein